MNSRLLTAIAMCCLCSMLLWVNGGNTAISILFAAVSLIGGRIHFKVNLRPYTCLLGLLLLALAFVIKNRFYLPFGSENIVSISNYALLNISQYIVSVMVIAIIIRRTNNIGLWFVACCFVVIALLDKIDSNAGGLEIACVFMNVAAAVIFWFSPETNVRYVGGRMIKTAAVISLLALTYYGSSNQTEVLYDYYRSGASYLASSKILLDNAAAERESEVGFSIKNRKIATTRINDEKGDRIALRLFGKVNPGYLKGKVYEIYRNGRWDSDEKYNLLLPDKKYSARMEDQNVFVLDPLPAENEGDVFEISTLRYFDGVLFRVPGTVALSVEADSLLQNNWGDLLSHNAKKKSYTVYSAARKRKKTLTTDVTARLTSVPDYIREELGGIAQGIFRNRLTIEQKIQALYEFWENARYSLDVDIPSGEEPLIHFVKNKPPAHCELYASAACILLRLANVPARYATGFMVSNYQDGCWIVQNKDAHAWVEAWDAAACQWIDVDVTRVLTNGRNTSDTAAAAGQLSMRQRFVVAWLNGGFAGVVKLSGKVGAGLITSIPSRPIRAIPAMIIVCGMAVYLLRKTFSAFLNQAERDSAVSRMLRQMRRMDRLLLKRGLVRKPSETILQFARRIERQGPCYAGRSDHIRWYKRYSKARYSENYDQNFDSMISGE